MATKEVSVLTQYFEDSDHTTFDARTKSERDRDYRDGIQWTKEDSDTLKGRKQPVITIDRIGAKVNALTGMERINRTDPKALPRNPGDEDAAEAVTKGLRYVADNADYDQKRSSFYENMIVEGTGACEWSIKAHDNGENEIIMTHVPWDRFFYDPASVRANYSDSLYFGHVIWMDSERAKDRWPKFKGDFADIMGQGSTSNTHDDKPVLWVDSSRKRVRIVKIYYVSDKNWYVATFTKGLEIENIISPFVDEDNQTYPALNPMSAYIDRDNNRYGIVRAMISPQDEINKRRSKLLFQLMVRQIRVSPGKSLDVESTRTELAKPDGVIKARPDDFEILPANDQTQGQFVLYQDAKDEIDAVGVNPTLQGKAGPALSGRALQLQQSAGVMELGTITDRKSQWDLTNYRIIYRLMRQFWKKPKWIRITDDQGTPEFTGINRPITLREKLEANPELAQNLSAQMEEQGIPASQLDLDRVVETQNSIGELDVDIIMEESPDVATLKTETFEQLASSGVLASLPLELILELMPNISSDTRQRIEDMISGGDDPEAQAAQAEAAQQEQEIVNAERVAEIDKNKSVAAKNFADEEKIQAETAQIISELAGEGEADL